MQDKQPQTTKTLSTAVHGLNRLAKETSPYLRQHRYNPVDWHPWGPEALARAKAEDKPIFLSIGYSACHWCHVMEAECFESPEIAAIMNELFVNVKVDREERPDLDSIYMNAVQMMTQSGGWPMSVWLTPDLKPFYGGTYFPPDDRYLSQGRPGFPTVCRSVAKFYREKRDAVERDAETIATTIRKYASPKPDGGELSAELLDRAARRWEAEFDTRYGGMRGAPKFPPAMTIMLNLRSARRLDRASLADSCAFTLEKMQRGGMYDQIGGGFHRYTVDERWLIPHFEKMLYDNALLMPAYAEGFAATGREEFRTTVAEIFEYLRREMTALEGGFYATQDADSEGHEGKFFVWTPAEVRDAVGDTDLEFALNAFGVSEQGNFEDKTSALWQPHTLDELAKQSGASTDAVAARLASIRKRLFAERERRVKPHRDEKILTSWNGLMIAGMVKAARLARLGPEPIEHARRAADFLLRVMKDPSGRLMAVHASGQTKLMGYLDDYAFLIAGLLELAAATGERRYFDSARELQATQDRHFADPDGGYYFTADDHEKLIVRSKDLQDNAVPSGNSVSVQNLLTLFEWTGDAAYRERAQRTLAAARLMMERAPMAFPMMLLGLDRFLSSPGETIVIAGDGREADALEAAAFKGFHPHRLVLRTRTGDDGVSILAGKNPMDGKAAAYVCRNFTCDRPTADPSALA